MGLGIFQSDHRSGKYSEEREILTDVESKLKTIVQLVGGSATLILTFKLLKNKSNVARYGINTALAISFFLSLFGLFSFSVKKRGEHVRRSRKIKAAVLNLSIGLLAIAAVLLFSLVNPQKLLKGGGCKVKTIKLEPDVIEYIKPPPIEKFIEQPQIRFSPNANMNANVAEFAKHNLNLNSPIRNTISPTIIQPSQY